VTAARCTGAPPWGSPDPSTAARRELRAWATAELARAGCVSAAAEADWLLDEAPDPEGLRAMVARRAAGEPLQYVIGWAPFGRLKLAVGPGVFVPRPETELLAGWGIDHVPPGATVVDLCSGSGAIALSVAGEARPGRVIAVERSPAALAWLRRNAAGTAVEVVSGDVTDPGLLAGLNGTVDVVLCNPPYVPDGTAVPPEVADHDPAEAVFGGADGLAVIRPVIALTARLLRPGGVAGIEHDDVHVAAVPDLLRADGRFTAVEEHADLAGRPRFATARRMADCSS